MLVLDEPTESLTRGESERLFEKIRSIKERGTAVVYISHRLPEVKGIADRITVLRDGETRGTFAAAAVSEDEILRLIIGRAVEQAFPDKHQVEPTSAPLLEVRGLTGDNFHGIDLQVQPGRDRRARGSRRQRAARADAGAGGPPTVTGRGARGRETGERRKPA